MVQSRDMSEFNTGGTAVMDRPPNPAGRPENLGPTNPPQEKKWTPPPIAAVRNEIIGDMMKYDTFVLRGYTGSGKSTYGAVYLYEAVKRANPGKKVRVIVAEPRQLLAEGISETVANINGWPLGGDNIGFYHGDKQNYSKENTQIVYTVNGSLKNRLREDLALKEYDGVFLDEIHLREVDQDAILIGLESSQRERARLGLKPLKIVVASAAADQRYADYFGNGIVKEVQGQKLHHVSETFSDKHIDTQDIPLEMARLAAEKIKDPTHKGDVLGFLPGRAEIQIAVDEFNRIMASEGLSDKYKCASLTGGGGNENKLLQKQLSNDDPTRDPIAAFATDVAETGATFPMLTKVIDSGFIRTNVFDPQSGLEILRTLPHSLEHYTQRLGRLGRTGEGEYYALFTKDELHDASKHPKNALPSILKSDLAPLVLTLKTMGMIDPYNVKYPDNPGKEKIDQAVTTLSLLGALNPNGTLTQEGREMAEIPQDLHFARMLVEAKKLGCAEEIALIAGFLNSTSSVFMPLGRGQTMESKHKEFIVPGSDFLTLLKVWNGFVEQGGNRNKTSAWARSKGLNLNPIFDAITMKQDLSKDESYRAAGVNFKNQKVDIEKNADNIKKCIIAGFADKILSKSGSEYSLAGGKKTGVTLGNNSVLDPNESPYIISGNIRRSERNNNTFATMNQTISAEIYNMLIEKFRHKKEAIASEERHEGEQQKQNEIKLFTPTIEEISQTVDEVSHSHITHTNQESNDQHQNFFTKIKNSIINFFRKFFRR